MTRVPVLRGVDAAERLEAVETRRIVIDQQDVWTQARDHLVGGLAVAGFANNDKSVMLREQRFDAKSENRVVVGDRDPD